MKIIQRGSMKILPGKMAEAMELMKEYTAAWTRMGMDPKKMMYRRVTGQGDTMNTFIGEYEWDSFAEMAAFFDKMLADPEMQKQMAKWGSVTESWPTSGTPRPATWPCENASTGSAPPSAARVPSFEWCRAMVRSRAPRWLRRRRSSGSRRRPPSSATTTSRPSEPCVRSVPGVSVSPTT